MSGRGGSSGSARTWSASSPAARLRRRPPLDRGGVAEALANCVALCGLRAAFVEMICTRGVSPSVSRDPREAQDRFPAFAVPFGALSRDALRRADEVSITSTAGGIMAVKRLHGRPVGDGAVGPVTRRLTPLCRAEPTDPDRRSPVPYRAEEHGGDGEPGNG